VGDVVRQLGEANPAVTISTYAHLFERADHASTARDAFEDSHAAMTGGGAWTQETSLLCATARR
jgi:hypothetical protein